MSADRPIKGPVIPKKHLGQHFLTDRNIARKIVSGLRPEGQYDQVLEIGPGMGILTGLLLQDERFTTTVIDIDEESTVWLQRHFPALEGRIIHADFLRFDLSARFGHPHRAAADQAVAGQDLAGQADADQDLAGQDLAGQAAADQDLAGQAAEGQVGIIGNFPYNISSQILFKALEHRQQIPELVGMFQKEVAERVAAPPGNKIYGILSVLIQAFYDIEYLFTVNPGVFHPPPKVRSGVIRLRRKEDFSLDCDEKLFFQVVRAAFNQRRKTLRNALAGFNPAGKADDAVLQLRAERLSVADFVALTQQLQTPG